MKTKLLGACMVAALPLLAIAQATPDLLKAASAEAGAVVTASGLVFRVLKEAKGSAPTAADKVRVHYRGIFADGREFDSSYARNEPAEFPLKGVIPCWTEGVQRMQVGMKARLTCPPAIAYGAAGAGRGVIPPNATLQFDIELLAVMP